MLESQPYRSSAIAQGPCCPLCELGLKHALSATCEKCGLWWIPGGLREAAGPHVSSAADFHSSLQLSLPLPQPLRLGTIPFLVFGYGASWLMFSHRTNASGVLTWAALLFCLPLGLLVGTSAAAALVQQLIHHFVPSHLEGEDSTLHVRVWNTWQGLLPGFRRTDVRVPRTQVVGIEFHTGQAGDTQLFLKHSSGWAFGTGWSGTKAAATQLTESLARWLASAPR